MIGWLRALFVLETLAVLLMLPGSVYWWILWRRGWRPFPQEYRVVQLTPEQTERLVAAGAEATKAGGAG